MARFKASRFLRGQRVTEVADSNNEDVRESDHEEESVAHDPTVPMRDDPGHIDGVDKFKRLTGRRRAGSFRSRPRLIAVALLLALVAAACGSSNGSSAETADPAGTTAATEQADGNGVTDTATGPDDNSAAATTQAPATGDTTPAVTAAGNTAATTTAATQPTTAAAPEPTTTTTGAVTTSTNAATTTTMAATTTTVITTTTMAATTTTAGPTTTTGPRIAPFDNDAQSNPVDWGLMSPTNNKTNSRTDEVSYPNGDNEDWVQFDIPNPSNTIYRLKSMELTCTLHGDSANAQLRAKVWQNGSAVTGAKTLAICGNGPVSPTVNGTQPIQIRVYFGLFGQDVHADYTLTVVYTL